MKKSMRLLIILNLFCASQCMIAYLALSISLSYIFSNTILIFSFFTGLYLMSMGLGVLIIERIHADAKKLTNLIFLNSIAGILLANPGIIGMIFLNEYARMLLRNQQWNLLFIIYPFGIIFTIFIGIVSGAELPLFSRLIEEERWPQTRPLIGVLTSDYFGAFFGIILFTFVLNPFLGLISGITVSQCLTLFVINFVFLSPSLRQGSTRTFILICLTNFYVIISLFLSRFLGQGIDSISALY